MRPELQNLCSGRCVVILSSHIYRLYFYFMSKFFSEFKDFAVRGNVVDMAVGVVIGAAFGKIVSSLVDGLIMPLVGVATGGMNFTDYKFVIQQAVTQGTEVIKPEVAITYGAIIQTIVDFLIVAFCIFVMIKFINRLRRAKAAEEATEAAAAAEPSAEEKLLVEIRDLLAAQAKISDKK